jgi:hypothetical protein
MLLSACGQLFFTITGHYEAVELNLFATADACLLTDYSELLFNSIDPFKIGQQQTAS